MKSGVGPFLSSFFLLLLGCSAAFAQGAKVSTENPAESERDRPQERANWFMRGRMVGGKPGAEQLHRAYDQKLNNRRLRGLARARAAQGTTGDATASPRPQFVTAPAGSPPWNFLGPAPTATAAFGSNQQNYGPAIGRVTAVAVDQGDTTGNTVYIGGASGGLWRTTNAVSAARTCDSNGVCTANVGWTPLTDGQATLTVGSIALQPGNSNLILVGSGEANNSADSYYGLGILRSTDAGANWNLISSATCPTQNPACPASGSVSFHGLGFTHVAFSTDAPSRVVATAAAASGGIAVGAETGGSIARGIYFSTDAGITWTRAKVTDDSTGATQITPDPASVNGVIYNAQQHKFYANLRFHGFYSSADGATWTRLANQPANITLTNCPSSNSGSGCPLYRAEMAIVPGRDEMYAWIYNSSENDIGIFQTKDGGQTWTQISTTGIDTCGDGVQNGCGNDSSGQGTYNIALAAVPNGTTATDLYAGGVNEYKCTINSATNPTCAASPFLNLTHVYGCNPAGVVAHVHPDEHGVDFLGNDGTGAFFTAHPSFSPPVFFGNDGGVYRVLQSSSLINGTCPALNSTPPSPFDNLSSATGFSMIQFVGFSQPAADATTLLGGTQDNGSPAASSASPSSGTWLSVNNGDGGFNAINPLNANEWFTSNPAPLTAGGGIQRCSTGIACTFQTFLSAITQDRIGGDFSSFYTFFTLDPQASGRMLVASCRVWSGNSDGSQSNSLGGNWSVNNSNGTPLSLNFDTQLAASCGDPQSNPTTFMVNTIAAGGPCNGPCNPGITPGSSSGGGSQVVWAGMEGIADASSAAAQCPKGLPCGGQVWVTTQADADLSTTPNKWTEVSGLGTGSTPTTSAACTSAPSACNINPKHYTISGIALDPKDATGKTAYVTVMGFGVGHIFKTTDAGATWAMLDGNPPSTGLPDAPADAVVADPNTAILAYVGTDVGVFSSNGDGSWTELGPSSGPGAMPNVAITQLKLYQNGVDVRLRASTYGRGLWEISIAAFQIASSPSTETVTAGGTPTPHTISITGGGGFNSPVTLTCTDPAPLSTCSVSTNPVNPGGSSILTITTTAPSVSQLRLPGSRRTVPLYALWLTTPGIVFGILGIGVAPRNRRGKLLGYIGLIAVLGILLMLASCGGGGGGTTTTPPIPKPGTPSGTYIIMVTGTSGSGATSLSHTTNITLTVN